MNRQKLIEHLKTISKDKSNECITEFFPLDNSIDGKICPCGKNGCHKLYEVKNIYTELSTYVGSSCILKFFTKESKEYLTKVLNKQNRLKDNDLKRCRGCGYIKCKCDNPVSHCYKCRKFLQGECKCHCEICNRPHQNECLDYIFNKGIYIGKSIRELYDTIEGYSYIQFLCRENRWNFNKEFLLKYPAPFMPVKSIIRSPIKVEWN